jgi:adenylate kinase family enzyme
MRDLEMNPHRRARTKTVILLVGPAGSGKTTLGSRIAQNEDWLHISEDDIWNEIGHPPHVLRTDAEQEVVQGRAILKIVQAVDAGLNVVFDFLVYDDPPVRIAEYEDALRRQRVDFVRRVLRPSVDSILERQRIRGRPSDLDVKLRRQDAEHQLACLAKFDRAHVIDTSDETPEETYTRHFSRLLSLQ